MEEFLKVMRNEQPSIRRHVSEGLAQQIAMNRQKFRSIVETIVLCDTVLRDYIATSIINAMYPSSRIQNQILDILGSTVVKKIVQRVRDATYFTVIADEVTDSSNKEQLSLVLRYVCQSRG